MKRLDFSFVVPPGESTEFLKLPPTRRLFCRAATASFQVILDENGSILPCKKDTVITPPGSFTGVRVYNPNNFEISVELLPYDGMIEDNEMSLSGSTTVSVRSGNNIASGSASINGKTKIISAHAERTSIILQNNGENEVWIGDENVVAGQGLKLLPAASLTLSISSSLWAVGSSELGFIEVLNA